MGVVESGGTPGGRSDGDSRFGGSMTTGGATTAGAGIPVCSGDAGSARVTGDCGGGGTGDCVGSDGPEGPVIGGAAVDGVGIGVCSGMAGVAERNCACATALPAARPAITTSHRVPCMSRRLRARLQSNGRMRCFPDNRR